MNVQTIRPSGAHDDLSDQDYRDIYDELRSGHTLRQVIRLAGSAYSPTWWSQYEAGAKPLTPRARNDLRRAVGLAELPLPPADLLAETVDPDAAIVQVGDDPQAGRVILLATGAPVTVTWDGDGPQIATSADVTGVTRAQPAKPVSSVKQSRKRYWRPCLEPEIGEYMQECGIDVNAVLRWWIDRRELSGDHHG